jgi:hypothetical protein
LNINIFKQLREEGLLSDSSLDRIIGAEQGSLFSVYWEIRTFLYAGVLLLTTGLGILIYKNIDTIGHQVILVLIGLLCIGCFYYCEKKKLPFSWLKVPAPNAYFDYILLLGCLTLVIFITYLQVQYTAFGEAYGLATFIPMIIFFFCAYYFDHLGVLSLAITNLAGWLGLVVTPMEILKGNNFGDAELIFAGLALGVFLVALAEFSGRKNKKEHFSFTYLNFGMNVLYIAILAGMFYFDRFYLAWLVPLALANFYFYTKAVKLSSFYFVLMMVIYSYIGLGYAFVSLVSEAFITLIYFISSGIMSIILLLNINQKLKKK